MKKYNHFITLEGIEGSGKTTAANRVVEKLEENNIKVFLTREPGGTHNKTSEAIRKLIMDDANMHPLTELFLFEASRSEHMAKTIKPELEKNQVTISDRFFDSTTIYQGLTKGISQKDVEIVNIIASQGIEPELTIILDLDPVISLNRLEEAGKTKREINRFDKEDLKFHQNIRESYLKVAKNSTRRKFIIIDASQSIDKVVEEILNLIYQLIKNEN